MTFLLIWLAGDLFNLAGIIMEKLMFTMVKKKKGRMSNYDGTVVLKICSWEINDSFYWLFGIL